MLILPITPMTTTNIGKLAKHTKAMILTEDSETLYSTWISLIDISCHVSPIRDSMPLPRPGRTSVKNDPQRLTLVWLAQVHNAYRTFIYKVIYACHTSSLEYTDLYWMVSRKS